MSFCFAQSTVADSLQATDSVSGNQIVVLPIPKNDSTVQNILTDSIIKKRVDNSFLSSKFVWQTLKGHPYFGFNSAINSTGTGHLRQTHGKDLIFYILISLLIFYALLRLIFPKYFNDLFRLFFRTTLKQRQIKEQLMQTPLPSLLLNGFFVVTASLYIAFVWQYFSNDFSINFWIIFFYSVLGLSTAYFIKFLGLKLSAWLFSMEEAASAYIFIVFVINKMIGIILLPFLILIAFSTGNVYLGSMTASWCIIGALFLYRFILTYAAIRNDIKVNPFHFLIYILGFEVAPLLLVYKGLLLFFEQTA